MSCNRIVDNKPPGLDVIPNQALEQAVKYRLEIFARLFDTHVCECPGLEKHQKLVLPYGVYQCGEPSLNSSTRVLNIMEKLQERLVYNRLLLFLESLKGLSSRVYRAELITASIKFITGLTSSRLR